MAGLAAAFFSAGLTPKDSFSNFLNSAGNSTLRVAWAVSPLIFLFFSFNCSLYSARDKALSGLSNNSSGGIGFSSTTFFSFFWVSSATGVTSSTAGWVSSTGVVSLTSVVSVTSSLTFLGLGFKTESKTKKINY